MLKNNSQNCQKVISAKVYSCDNKNNVTLLIDAGCESCTSSCIMSTASKKITLYNEKKYKICLCTQNSRKIISLFFNNVFDCFCLVYLLCQKGKFRL